MLAFSKAALEKYGHTCARYFKLCEIKKKRKKRKNPSIISLRELPREASLLTLSIYIFLLLQSIITMQFDKALQFIFYHRTSTSSISLRGLKIKRWHLSRSFFFYPTNEPDCSGVAGGKASV